MANVVTEHSNQEATTMIHTHQTAPTRFVEADEIRFAYRRFGKPGTISLLLLGYFNSNMDGWDPDVTNSLAADHEVILFDDSGVGASGGKTPNLVAEMAEPCVAFCRALGLKQIHVVGFSLGGMIGQQLSEDERTVKTAHLKPACRNGPYEAGVISKDRYAAYLIKARRKLST